MVCARLRHLKAVASQFRGSGRRLIENKHGKKANHKDRKKITRNIVCQKGFKVGLKESDKIHLKKGRKNGVKNSGKEYRQTKA